MSALDALPHRTGEAHNLVTLPTSDFA